MSGEPSASLARRAIAVPEANAVAAYRVDPSSGSFKSVLGSPFTGGNSPISVVVHPSGKFVYSANQTGNDISLFDVDSNTGELKEVMPRTPAGLNPTAMITDSGGDLIFVANETSNNVSVFSVSASDGTLTEIQGSPFPAGAKPVALALSPSGQFLYVGSGNLALVFGFTVTSGTGSLATIPGSPFTVGSAPFAKPGKVKVAT